MTRAALAAIGTALLSACQALQPIPEGVCGNAVIDSNEDCDGFPRQGLDCRAAGLLGECHLDCSPKSDGTRNTCPEGFGCDEQMVCRKANGSYRALPDVVPGNAASLSSGDFDGDGRADIVSQEPAGAFGFTKLRVHYFDAGGVPSQTWALPKPVTSPIVADVSGDGRTDLIYSDAGVGILLGERDRSLITEPSASYYLAGTKALILPILDLPIDGTAPLVVLTDRDGDYGLYQADPATFLLSRIADLPAGISSFAAEPVMAHVFEDGARYPCLDIALGYRGAREISIYSVCDRDPETDAIHLRPRAAVTRVALEPPATVDRGLLLADVDGDGHLDVLVGASSMTTYVAYGDGRSISTARLLTVTDIDGQAINVAMPLAAGDVSGDGVADLVLSQALLVSTVSPDGSVVYRGTHTNFGAPWTEARVADFNGDGKNDVIAASSNRLDLDFFKGTGSQFTNAFTVPTTQPVSHLTVGDFDGDSIFDLAFVEHGSGSEARGQLSIAFGSGTGPPTAPVAVAHVDGIEQVTSIISNFDAVISDLVVAYQQSDASGDSGSAIAIIEGSGDRTLLAPIELTTFATDGSLESVESFSAILGRFTREDRLDVLPVGIGGTLMNPIFGLWLLPDISSRQSRPQYLGWGFDTRLTPFRLLDNLPEFSLRMSSGDLDQSGLDDAVIAAPNEDGMQCIIASAAVTLDAFPVDIAGLGPSTSFRSVPGDTVLLDDSCSEGGELRVSDVDGDGAPDILILTGTEASSRQLWLLWNDGSGHFSASDAVSVLGNEQSPRSFTVFHQGPEAPLSLAYVTEGEVHMLRSEGSLRSFADLGTVASLERGTGIVVADVNGDGVRDLVVADAGSVRVFRAELSE